MSDTPTLVRFFSGWQHDGNGPDGLPLYRETVRVRMDRPPYLGIEREAEEEDIIDHPGPYELYQKTCTGRKEIVGYPLALWPACPPHIFQMCAQRDIHTVEQLAQLVAKKRRSEAAKTVPPDVARTGRPRRQDDRIARQGRAVRGDRQPLAGRTRRR